MPTTIAMLFQRSAPIIGMSGGLSGHRIPCVLTNMNCLIVGGLGWLPASANEKRGSTRARRRTSFQERTRLFRLDYVVFGGGIFLRVPDQKAFKQTFSHQFAPTLKYGCDGLLPRSSRAGREHLQQKPTGPSGITVHHSFQKSRARVKRKMLFPFF